jgi:hypothetical protein
LQAVFVSAKQNKNTTALDFIFSSNLIVKTALLNFGDTKESCSTQVNKDDPQRIFLFEPTLFLQWV